MNDLRDIAAAMDPLVLLRSIAAAWPLAVAIVLDWAVLASRRTTGRRGVRAIARRFPLGSLGIAIVINAAALGATIGAVALVDALFGWLPGRFGSGIVRLIAEQRLRSWEGVALLVSVTACIVAGKVITLRILESRWPGYAVGIALLAAWAGTLVAVWAGSRVG
ncbi:MAG: hypothetical protein ACTS3F_14200 [Phycisphaerales bacterium]